MQVLYPPEMNLDSRSSTVEPTRSTSGEPATYTGPSDHLPTNSIRGQSRESAPEGSLKTARVSLSSDQWSTFQRGGEGYLASRRLGDALTLTVEGITPSWRIERGDACTIGVRRQELSNIVNGVRRVLLIVPGDDSGHMR